jgi:hypothetical protein
VSELFLLLTIFTDLVPDPDVTVIVALIVPCCMKLKLRPKEIFSEAPKDSDESSLDLISFPACNLSKLPKKLRGAPAAPSAIATGLSRNAVTVVPEGKPPTPTAVFGSVVQSAITAT